MNHNSFAHSIDVEPWGAETLRACGACDAYAASVRRRLNLRGAPLLCGRCFETRTRQVRAAKRIGVVAMLILAFSGGERWRAHGEPVVVLHRETEVLTGDTMVHPEGIPPAPDRVGC
jgi:hypothetical protein